MGTLDASPSSARHRTMHSHVQTKILGIIKMYFPPLPLIASLPVSPDVCLSRIYPYPLASILAAFLPSFQPVHSPHMCQWSFIKQNRSSYYNTPPSGFLLYLPIRGYKALLELTPACLINIIFYFYSPAKLSFSPILEHTKPVPLSQSLHLLFTMPWCFSLSFLSWLALFIT